MKQIPNRIKEGMYMLSGLLCLTACTPSPTTTITLQNPLAITRTEEIVEIKAGQWTNTLSDTDKESFVLYDEKRQEIPYQITHEGNLIFPVTLAASEKATYTLEPGIPAVYPTVACGRHYPERLDDIAWENDCSAYRAYGPALQQSGERGFGYDILTKSVTEPVIEKRYAMELDTAARAQIKHWNKAGEHDKADSLARAISYHIDHGNGMDCYNVGPTLGAGTAALLQDSTIIYPYCYKDFEILDNGPLRFTVRLTYHPMEVNGEEVIESRLISLDKGSNLNKTQVTYQAITQETPVVVGIVIHPENRDGYQFDETYSYIAYVDSTNNAHNNNGEIYVGAIIPETLKEIRVRWANEQERKAYAGALGHILAVSSYKPGTSFTYYWGSGWSKGNITSATQWNEYLKSYKQKLDHPIVVLSLIHI